MAADLDVDVLIFGGGVAGLWLLDELRRQGRRTLLLEAAALGTGQTVAAQGIIHGGLKYTLSGRLSEAARAIRDMPDLWRSRLAGRGEPNLATVRLRSDGCYLWRTDGLRSRAAMVGARTGLRVAPAAVRDEDRPQPLARCPGAVYRLREQVIDPVSFLRVMRRRNAEHLLRIDAEAGLDFDLAGTGEIKAVRLRRPAIADERRESAGDGSSAHDRGSPERPSSPQSPLREPRTLRPAHVVFAAGVGNAALRRRAGLDPRAMQRRPLHMVLLRGELPALHGHCVDGAATRATISSDIDAASRTVWQVGGRIAEAGVNMDERELIRHARRELAGVLPGVSFDGAEWATYRVDRAEPAAPGGGRPDDAQLSREGNVITAWPTKLALAPHLADRIAHRIGPGTNNGPKSEIENLPPWPRPDVAPPPWEQPRTWIREP